MIMAYFIFCVVNKMTNMLLCGQNEPARRYSIWKIELNECISVFEVNNNNNNNINNNK